jgi:uracil-DNA glycosylase family 4
MGGRLVNSQRELADVVRHLRRLVVVDESLGFEPPTLSLPALSYLARKHPRMGSLENLREYIGDCTRCKLCKGRRKLVFGEGSGKARLVFVGEAPGREEDMEGRPFVGEAGKLLTKIIESGMGIGRKDVYICNVIKCRPPNNRDPEKDEIETCRPFLEEQIRIINPEVICALGRIAAKELSGRDFHMTKERGQWFSYGDIPVMPTFHPAYLLRNPSAKRQVWEDAKKIMKRLGLEVKRNG